MIAEIRYKVSKLIPNHIKWSLIKKLPRIVDWSAKFFQGISPLWNYDETFSSVYTEVFDRSLLDKKRAYILYKFAISCSSLPGDYAELGTYRGAGVSIMKKGLQSNKPPRADAAEVLVWNKNIWAFDTFEGLPETDASNDPYWKKGDMDETSLDDIKEFLSDSCFKIVPGLFPKSTSNIPDNLIFSLVHIDADIYQSTVDGCEYFYDKIVPGGILLFDDYGFLSCPGVKTAVDAFFESKPETPIYLPSGQCFIIKR